MTDPQTTYRTKCRRSDATLSAEQENMEESKSTEATGQKIVCSGIKWSALYQDQRHLKRSAEGDSAPAEEWPMLQTTTTLKSGITSQINSQR